MLELQFEPGTACGLLTRSDSSTGVLTLNLHSELDFRVDGQLLCPLPPFPLLAYARSFPPRPFPLFLSHQHSGISLPLPSVSSSAHQGNPIP